MGALPVVLLDIDTQRDFCDRDGTMYVPGSDSHSFRRAQALLSGWARAHDVPHIAAADTHVSDEPDFSSEPDMMLTHPPHCVRGTWGHERIRETAMADPLVIGMDDDGRAIGRLARDRREFVLEKNASDVFVNPNTAHLMEHLDPQTVVVCGVATDYCVAAAIQSLRMHRPQAHIVVATDAIAGVFPDSSARAIAEWSAHGTTLLRAHRVVTSGLLGARGPRRRPVRLPSAESLWRSADHWIPDARTDLPEPDLILS